MDPRKQEVENVTGSFDASISPRGLLSGPHRKPTLILILSALIVTTWKYYGSQYFYLSDLQSYFVLDQNPGLTSEVYVFLAAFILMGVIPALVIRYVFHERLSEYGFGIGDWRFGWKAVLVMAPVMVLATYPSASMPEFVREYPIYKGAGETTGTFINHALRYLLFYVGWETLFRGFMQFGLRSLGDWNAILIQTTVSCIAHIGKPPGEIYSSIIGALVWGVVVFRSRSLLYVLIVHWLLGVSLDWFIVSRMP